MLGQYQQSLDEAERLANSMYAVALVALGRDEDARAAIDIQLPRFGGNAIEHHFVAHLKAFIGAASREEGCVTSICW